MSIADYLLSLVPVVLVAFIEFGLKSRMGVEFIKLITLKYIFLIIIFLYGGIFSFTQGLQTGKNGRGLFTNKQKNLIELKGNEEDIRGRIYFSVGDYLLIYCNEEENPILLQKDLIANITVSQKATPDSLNNEHKKIKKK